MRAKGVIWRSCSQTEPLPGPLTGILTVLSQDISTPAAFSFRSSTTAGSSRLPPPFPSQRDSTATEMLARHRPPSSPELSPPLGFLAPSTERPGTAACERVGKLSIASTFRL